MVPKFKKKTSVYVTYSSSSIRLLKNVVKRYVHNTM